MFQEVKNLYQKLNNDLHVKIGRRATLQQKLAGCDQRIQAAQSQAERLTKASVFLQTLNDATRQQIIGRISSIVTDALQKVKDPNLEFRMKLSTERNQADVQFSIYNANTKQEYDILESCGGSIADIVSFPLRVSLLLKWDPVLSRILIMDENFKFVSVADREPLADFVKQITERLNLQVILVTHANELSGKAHKIFQVNQKQGVSSVEEKPS